MMKIKIELENGDCFEGYLDDKEVAFLEEKARDQQAFYRKHYPGEKRAYNMATEIVCGIIAERVRDPRYNPDIKIDR